MSSNVQPARAESRLFTAHGTVMFVDQASGELRHGRLEGSPDNVVLTECGEAARIRLLGADGYQDIECLSEYSAVVGSARIGSDFSGSVFTVAPAGGAEFGLTRGAHFLSAEPDGRVTLSRAHCQDWERFHRRVDARERTGTVVSQRIDGQIIRFFITDRNDWIQRHQCRADFFERDMLDEIRRHCQPERAFVDIGANIGNHAVFISKFCSVGEIVVFEPNPQAIEILQINLALNSCQNVDSQYLGLALGAEPKMVRPFSPAADNLGGVQMVEDQLGKIRCIQGDDVLLSKDIGFIKIDVEGMEFDVLQGLRRTIERWRPVICIEVWSQAKTLLEAWCDNSRYRIEKELMWDNYILYPR
jgi:FkbM family methyltransferase